MRAKFLALVGAVGALVSCGGAERSSDPLRPPTVTFSGGAIVNGGLDPALSFAWEQARTSPQNGLAYSFAARTSGLPTGTRVDLVMARNLGLSVNGIPVIEGGYDIVNTATRADGWAVFDPLGVDTENWAAANHAVPAALLCGETVVMARAMDASGTTVVASTYLLIVTAPCP